jgi:hypothetical protein
MCYVPLVHVQVSAKYVLIEKNFSIPSYVIYDLVNFPQYITHWNNTTNFMSVDNVMRSVK